MSVNDERQDVGAPPPAESTVGAPGPPPSEDLEETEPDEIVVRVTDDRAIVFARPDQANYSRWGRSFAEYTTDEVKSLLQKLDPVARAVIEAKRLTGALVELHPADREMFKSGFRAISEEGGWLQANFRDHGQVTRLMRIRPATGIAVMSGGALILAGIAAQAQAAEMADAIKAIGQRVDQINEHLQDDQVGAVEHAVHQIEEMVGLLRAHGRDGVSKSDVSVARNALGDASRKCMKHLKTAVKNLEESGQGSTRQAEQVLSERAVDEVVLYLDLVNRLHAAMVQFALAQVAFDCHRGKAHVAVTRAGQLIATIEKYTGEIEEVDCWLRQLDESVRAQFQPWWMHAGREIPGAAGLGVAAGAGGGAALAVAPAAADAVQDEDGGGGSDVDARQIVHAAAVGALAGFIGGLVVGTKNTMDEVNAQEPVEERLEKLTAARCTSLESSDHTAPILDWVHLLTRELTPAAS